MTAQMTAAITVPDPPTAPGLPIVGNALTFMATKGLPMEFMRESALKYGDVVRFKVGNRSLYLVSHPDLVHDILVKRVEEFRKGVPTDGKPVALARFLGSGILTADHEEWRPQRKLVQPLMHTKHIASYADTMARFGDQLLGDWQDGSTRDIHADMTQVTMWIIAETMFGMNVNQTPTLEAAGREAQEIAISDLFVPLPPFLSGGRDRNTARINDFLSELVEHFMQERRTHSSEDRHDLLTLLMNTRDEDGNPVSDEFVRDNILTLFFAGHETTANTLTWTFYYLDKNPDVTEKLRQEVDAVLGGRLPTLADLPNLPYTMMVIKETMRIEPTVAAFPRFVANDLEIGGYQLKGGNAAFVSPYVMHHDPRWWSEPEKFDPTRFSAENEDKIPKYAYLPFGGGPRVCIGNYFALMEAQILLAVIASRYQLKLVPGTHVEPVRRVTTAPKAGLPMMVERRT